MTDLQSELHALAKALGIDVTEHYCPCPICAHSTQWCTATLSSIMMAIREASPPVTPCTCLTAHDRAVCVGWCACDGVPRA